MPILKTIKNKNNLLCFLLLLGCLIRLIGNTELPGGLNQDEASAGYDAFSLLQSGVDRNGNSFPMYFVAWGSGQNVLYSYLSMPFIASLGLNVFSVRLLASLAGMLTLFIFYLLCKKIRGQKFALVALFLLVINPWHIMMCRWALESNLLPLVLLSGIYLLVLSLEKKYLLPAAAVVFGLALYAYATSMFFLLFFFLFAGIYLIRIKIYSWKIVLPSVFLFLLIALPMIFFMVINTFKLHSMDCWGMTIPRLTEEPRLHTHIFTGGKLIDPFLNIVKSIALLFTFSDRLHSNVIPGFGIFYLIGLPFIIYGLLSTDRKNKGEMLILAAVLASAVCSIIVYVNVNRMNMAYLPLLYFNAVGFIRFIQKFPKWKFSAWSAYACLFLLFISIYTTIYKKNTAPLFYSGLSDAIHYAENTGKDHWYMTTEMRMPYIFILFYRQLPAEEFYTTVKYKNDEAPFREVTSFSRYTFGEYKEDPKGVYIVRTSEIKDFPSHYTFREFGTFAVGTGY